MPSFSSVECLWPLFEKTNPHSHSFHFAPIQKSASVSLFPRLMCWERRTAIAAFALQVYSLPAISRCFFSETLHRLAANLARKIVGLNWQCSQESATWYWLVCTSGRWNQIAFWLVCVSCCCRWGRCEQWLLRRFPQKTVCHSFSSFWFAPHSCSDTSTNYRLKPSRYHLSNLCWKMFHFGFLRTAGRWQPVFVVLLL